MLLLSFPSFCWPSFTSPVYATVASVELNADTSCELDIGASTFASYFGES